MQVLWWMANLPRAMIPQGLLVFVRSHRSVGWAVSATPAVRSVEGLGLGVLDGNIEGVSVRLDATSTDIADIGPSKPSLSTAIK